MASEWQWDPTQQDYYMVTGTDQYGNYTCTWARQAQAETAGSPSDTPLTRQDSPQQQLGPGVPPSVRADPHFIQTQVVNELTTNLRLDETYFVRTGGDARRFFVKGKVFAMLYTEPAGAQSVMNGNDDAYSYVKFDQIVYSQIRRFVVVDVRRGFVYACAISTYRGRGTNKSGCIPSEHTIVHFPGTDPQYFQGEYQAGMTKDPIQIDPADNTLQMNCGSRIRFSKQYPIEMNVKVKDIGRVSPRHLSKLLEYHAQYQR